MRFCMLSTFYPPWSFGGDGRFVRALSHELADRGHEVTVVHSREAWRVLSRDDDAKPPSYPGGRDGAVEVVSVDAGALSPLATYLSGRPLLARRALERAVDRDFDVLHFHNPSLLGGPGLLEMGRPGPVRLYTAHEQWLVCPMHVLFKYNREPCEDRSCWRCSLSFRRPPQLWRSTGLLPRALGSIDALIAPSATTARLHAPLAGRVRIEHIPHFVAEPAPPLDAAPREPYFLYAGRLEPIKGVVPLARAFAQRREPLLVAGTGSEERRIRDAPGVRLLGWVEAAEIDALYRGALALIVPTLGHESLPLVVLEALARGTPVVANRFGVLEELARETGALLTYGSIAELHAALDRLAGEPRLRDALAGHGRRAFRERWTADAHVARYLSLIEELAGRLAGAPA